MSIASFFPNRTDAMIKNRFNWLQRLDPKEKEFRTLCHPLILQLVQLRVIGSRRRRTSPKSGAAAGQAVELWDKTIFEGDEGIDPELATLSPHK
jgi:hypothetical protein